METSDSECFESADEDFVSDEEDTKTVTSPTADQTIKKEVEVALKNLESLNLAENKAETSLVSIDDNQNTDVSRAVDLQVSTNDDNNSQGSTIKNSKLKEGREPKRKLGEKVKKNESDNKVETATGIAQTAVDKLEKKVEKVEVAIKTPTEKVEENLWDEAEIDWGKENLEETNMWENDTWEPMERKKTPEISSSWGTQPRQNSSWGTWGTMTQPQNIWEPLGSPQPQNSSWAGTWGSWGVSSILSTATQGVSSLTQGITTALESGIGVPDPEELARINAKETVKHDQEEPDRNVGFGLGNLVMGVSHLTKLVESTGTKVISGGLDTLESIGKKTMEVLQEGDPGLKKKRAFLKINQDRPVLSQLLREAKEKAENENKILEAKHFAKKAKNYETLFDDHQGLVHLEALEMLSKQCDIKLQTLIESYSGDTLTEMQETMDQVKELCELPDEDDDEQATFDEIKEKLEGAVAEINIPITYKKLFETWEETEAWLNSLNLEVCDERELHQQAIEALAQLTAIAVEQFHKSGELLLVKERRSTADEADSLVQLTTSLVALIGIVAAKFSDKLNVKSSSCRSKEEINGLITNVFFEAANSSSYIQDAFQLLIPVLQVGAV